MAEDYTAVEPPHLAVCNRTQHLPNKTEEETKSHGWSYTSLVFKNSNLTKKLVDNCILTDSWIRTLWTEISKSIMKCCWKLSALSIWDLKRDLAGN